MAAAQKANVTEDGIDTVVRFCGKVRLRPGPVLVREIEATGEIVLTPIPPASDAPDTWAAFLDYLAQTPRDPEFMKKRPMNRPAIDRKLFSDD